MENTKKDLEVIKFRTYKKCRRQFKVGLVLFLFGILLFSQESQFSFLPIVIGFVLSVSSFFGIRANKLNEEELERLKK